MWVKCICALIDRSEGISGVSFSHSVQSEASKGPLCGQIDAAKTGDTRDAVARI